jgi:hypothetical protein
MLAAGQLPESKRGEFLSTVGAYHEVSDRRTYPGLRDDHNGRKAR